MLLPLSVPSKLIVSAPWTAPKLIVDPVSVPVIVPAPTHDELTVIAPDMDDPDWVNVTRNVPVVPEYFVLA